MDISIKPRVCPFPFSAWPQQTFLSIYIEFPVQKFKVHGYGARAFTSLRMFNDKGALGFVAKVKCLWVNTVCVCVCVGSTKCLVMVK